VTATERLYLGRNRFEAQAALERRHPWRKLFSSHFIFLSRRGGNEKKGYNEKKRERPSKNEAGQKRQTQQRRSEETVSHQVHKKKNVNYQKEQRGDEAPQHKDGTNSFDAAASAAEKPVHEFYKDADVQPTKGINSVKPANSPKFYFISGGPRMILISLSEAPRSIRTEAMVVVDMTSSISATISPGQNSARKRPLCTPATSSPSVIRVGSLAVKVHFTEVSFFIGHQFEE